MNWVYGIRESHGTAGTTGSTGTALFFANLVMCSPFGSLRCNNLIMYMLTNRHVSIMPE